MEREPIEEKEKERRGIKRRHTATSEFPPRTTPTPPAEMISANIKRTAEAIEKRLHKEQEAVKKISTHILARAHTSADPAIISEFELLNATKLFIAVYQDSPEENLFESAKKLGNFDLDSSFRSEKEKIIVFAFEEKNHRKQFITTLEKESSQSPILKRHITLEDATIERIHVAYCSTKKSTEDLLLAITNTLSIAPRSILKIKKSEHHYSIAFWTASELAEAIKNPIQVGDDQITLSQSWRSRPQTTVWVGGFQQTHPRKIQVLLKRNVPGFVSFKVLKTPNGTSRGCGFITLKNEEDVERCLSLMLSVPITESERASGKVPLKLQFELPQQKEKEAQLQE
jgi:hypothetical protein